MPNLIKYLGQYLSNAAGAKEDHRNEKESDLVCLFSLIFRIPPFHFGKSFFFAMLL